MRIAAAAMLVASWLRGPACARAETPGRQVADFAIYKPGTNDLIGHARYIVETQGEDQAVTGEYRYSNGSYDIEHDKLKMSASTRMPTLVTFEHTFYRPDGSRDHTTGADSRSGLASCTGYEKDIERKETKTLSFPSDTYAGATVIFALQHYLADDAQGVIEFHAFNCVPGPKILAVKAYPSRVASWRYRAGEVMQVDVKPDFGWLNLVIAPFVPDIHAWFEPGRNLEFDGAQFTRYYKGLELVLVRTPGGTSKPPELSAVKPPELSNAVPTPASSP